MLPKYRHYVPKDLAVVRLKGRDIYLGRYGSDESIRAYARVLLGQYEPGLLTLGALINRYTEHARIYYTKQGRPTSEQDNIRQALSFLDRSLLVEEFRPATLRRVREVMIAAGRCRGLINKDVHRIRALFRWAVAEELVPPDLHQALRTVEPLREGRTSAREAPGIRPVPMADVEATIAQIGPAVGAMIRLQLLTGARPGEIAAMRPCDVADGVYRPAEHKAEHHDRSRVILLGKKALELLRPWLDRPATAYWFTARSRLLERIKLLGHVFSAIN